MLILFVSITSVNAQTYITLRDVQKPDAMPKGLVLVLVPARLKDLSGYGQIHSLVNQDYVVALVSSPECPYTRNIWTDCDGLTGEMNALVKQLQITNHIDQALKPIVIGFEESAEFSRQLSLVGSAYIYAAISLNWCPQTDSNKSQVQSADGDKSTTHSPWFVFQSRQWNGCRLSRVQSFLSAVPDAKLTIVDSDFSEQTKTDKSSPFIALMQWLDPSLSHQVQASGLQGLPLIENTVAGATRVAILVTGDGGWADLDKSLAAKLVAKGIAVVGWDSLSYFWQVRTPNEFSQDLARVIGHYQSAWGTQEVILVGYSFGANVLPFAVAELSETLRSSIRLVALLSPSAYATFEFHLTDWLKGSQTTSYPVEKAITDIKSIPLLCIYGHDDEEAACPALHNPGETLVLAGDHHFDGAYEHLAELIVHMLDLEATTSTH